MPDFLTAEQVADLIKPKAPQGIIAKRNAAARNRSDTLEQRKWRKDGELGPFFNHLSGNYITWHVDSGVSLKCLGSGGQCLTPTVYKVSGIPLCTVHALIKMGELLDERDGFDWVTAEVSNAND